MKDACSVLGYESEHQKVVQVLKGFKIYNEHLVVPNTVTDFRKINWT